MVEQQVGDSETWQEVRPDAVTWTVPPKVIWTPPTENLRPMVALLPDLQGEAKLEASLGDKTASVAFTPKRPDRTPGSGGPLGAGSRAWRKIPADRPEPALFGSGRKDGHQEPAADVRWPENFENEYVKWEAPVLTAKQEGYTQFLRAKSAGGTCSGIPRPIGRTSITGR